MQQRLFNYPCTRRADLAACREMLRGGSRSFFAASLLLPSNVRDPASALYAFCRLADDVVDVGGGRLPALERLHQRLELAYAGRPQPVAVDRAFADVVARFAIPPALPRALLEGLEWDALGRRYETIAELNAYAARVAGAVGAMMTLLMGVRTSDEIARASQLGVAMQLTNIARDVGEDAQAGRVYLPLQWLRAAAIEPEEFLANPRFSPQLGSVIRRLLRTADGHYMRATAGIAGLPRACRPGIHAARLLYTEIGRQVERNGLDSVSQRAVVGPSRKLQLVTQALTAKFDKGTVASESPVPETAFLVEAVTNEGWWKTRRSLDNNTGVRPSLDDRISWVIGLFADLERRDRMARGGVDGALAP